MNRFTLSHDSVTCRRSPEVSSTAFDAQPPDLPPVSLMDMGFAVICPLARHRRPRIRFLFIGSPLFSTLLSGPAPQRVLCWGLLFFSRSPRPCLFFFFFFSPASLFSSTLVSGPASQRVLFRPCASL